MSDLVGALAWAVVTALAAATWWALPAGSEFSAPVAVGAICAAVRGAALADRWTYNA